jgi:hypothetical protein
VLQKKQKMDTEPFSFLPPFYGPHNTAERHPPRARPQLSGIVKLYLKTQRAAPQEIFLKNWTDPKKSAKFIRKIPRN